MNAYPYVKALHLVAVVSWFAGLLYIVRLFIYHVEAQSRPEPERSILQTQFALMERRLWFGITWPAMVAAATFGIWLMILTHAWDAAWFQLKACFLALLIAYHFLCGRIRSDLALGRCRLSSMQLRIWNEVATLLLFAIIFTAVMKSPSATAKGMLGVAIFAAVLVAIMSAVRKRRKGKPSRG